MQLQTALIPEPAEEIFARIFREYRPRTPLAGVNLIFKRYANANSAIAWRDSRLEVKLSDLWQGAPAPVIEALAHILIAKMFRKEAPAHASNTYRRWLNRQDVRRDMQLVKQLRGRKFVSGPEGKAWNLETIFEELNVKYFDGLMARPDLGWSRRPSRTTLGHYDPSHHAIILSSLMDSPAVNRLAVEYVLYHEMLHLKHPVDHRGARRCVHTHAFHAEEKLFEGLEEAKEILKKLCASARSHYWRS
ncbi:MAG: M48 family peptidase [Bryobacteraceae bacterium]|nr:M48 family peptidase [Bryobacteraceae bacterium]